MEETTNSNANSNSKPSSSFAKRIASAFRSVTKSKPLFSLFEKLSLFSHKIHSQTLSALVRSRHAVPVEIHLLEDQNQKDQQLYLDYYGAGEKIEEEEDHENDRYPDLTHYLFEEEDDEEDDPEESVIDIVKNENLANEDFKLEDEIDHVADLFITKFHKQLRLQKLDSFKRYKEMLKRSV